MPIVESDHRDTTRRRYQALKGRIHQDLLNRLNLDRLTQTSRADAEPEIRSVIRGLLDRENQSTPLSLVERESLIGDVLNELFGLGPLEVAAQGSGHLGHPGQQARRRSSSSATAASRRPTSSSATTGT